MRGKIRTGGEIEAARAVCRLADPLKFFKGLRRCDWAKTNRREDADRAGSAGTLSNACLVSSLAVERPRHYYKDKA